MVFCVYHECMRSISEILSFVCMWQTAGYQSTPSWPLTTSRDRTPLPWAGRCTWGVPISTENKYDMMKTDAFRTNNGKVATWLAWNVLQTFVFEIVLKFVTAYQSATMAYNKRCMFVCLFVSEWDYMYCHDLLMKKIFVKKNDYFFDFSSFKIYKSLCCARFSRIKI